MQTVADQLTNSPTLHRVVVPDIWQQQAVGALRAGQDVVVHAPTGAGKTLIFELWSNQGRNRGQAIYTVPTRALANDKLAEWRARGWDVGIATGDLAENLSAPVLVATLETQKNRLIQGEGPALLVVDEYQMIADPDRGLNYELALALAPPQTRLLLLSGSVGNPQDVVKWLRRLGRDAVLVRHDIRPVPLEEVWASQLSYHLPNEVRGYWPRLVAKALAEDLGPVLIFAPRRQATEALALELSRQLPNPFPLHLSLAQKNLVGEHLARMLKCRIAYHHSGLSYGARAGVIEPLAKAGQLRAVVATMGLAAGINFSLRSVALAGESYRRDQVEQPLKGDEILQMFGRAGRRGIDEMGYALISANEIRLREAQPCHLSRNGMVDWSALLHLMSTAVELGREPLAEAVRVQERLFTVKPITLGVEESMKHPAAPCGLMTDAERARHVKRRVRQMRNSRGEWQAYGQPTDAPLANIRVLKHETPQNAPPSNSLDPATATAAAAPDATTPLPTPPSASQPSPTSPSPKPMGPDRADGVWTLHPALTDPSVVEKVGLGSLEQIEEHDGARWYGRAVTVAERGGQDRVILAKWVRRLTGWPGRHAPLAQWEPKIRPLIEKRLAEQQKTPVARWLDHPTRFLALVRVGALTLRTPMDAYGVPLWRPPEREVLPADCAQCQLIATCRQLSTATGTAMLWRRLGLVDAAGKPTLRGRVVSFFSQGDGLAIAAALEDKQYPLEDLVYDLANLDAGFRFCGEENRWAGRLAITSQRAYGIQSIPGYLETGVPIKYGSGAEAVVAAVHKNPASKSSWVKEWLGVGDIDRIIIEWRSLLRQIAHAPTLDWPRWNDLQNRAREILRETESPTLTELPPLEFLQTKRVDHRLDLRRH